MGAALRGSRRARQGNCGLRVEVHSDLQSALGAWSELYRADDRATPFGSPAWGEAALASAPWLERPWIALASEGGRAVAVASLGIRRRGPMRILRPLGGEYGDYWDVLALQEARDEAVAAVANELAARGDEWDLVSLPGIAPGSAMPGALQAAGLRLADRATLACPGLTLPSTFDDYLAALSSSHRKRVRQYLGRLDGELELREVRDPAELGAAAERWHEIRSRQWRGMNRRIYPLHEAERFRAFIRELVARLVPAGTARLWELRAGDELAGAYLNFIDHRTFYWYLGGFEPKFARLGVGNIATAHGIRTAISEGCDYFDFATGAEPYKYWYGAHDRFSTRLLAAGSGVRSRSAVTLRRVARRISDLRARIGEA